MKIKLQEIKKDKITRNLKKIKLKEIFKNKVVRNLKNKIVRNKK